jgi:hypothetical protein
MTRAKRKERKACRETVEGDAKKVFNKKSWNGGLGLCELSVLGAICSLPLSSLEMEFSKTCRCFINAQ